MDTLKQVGELLFGSIPTILFLLIVWIAYRSIVYGKLQKILRERHARTEGAIQEAQSEISRAESRTAEYERKLRDARSRIYEMQEARRRHFLQKRSAALAEARQQADEKVKSAELDLQRDVEEAQVALRRQAEVLAEEIIDSILKPLVAMEGR
jgi:F-type H+-transporting ATPase subunit b